MSEIANTVRRFPMSLPSGLHTDEVADLIESQAAEIKQLKALLFRYLKADDLLAKWQNIKP